ncbi:MAG TPA: DUF6600 domain-containing protein [Gemmatimonadaceae bacterium]|nr:DUF6600 domain-containing protein [Gemmatimonadaceae bacterium]
MRPDRVSLIAALLIVAGCYGYSQSTESPGPVPTPPDADDPPAHVGRLAFFEGAVSFRAAAADTWAIPEPNRPVTTGDALWVDSVGHVEVEVGPNAFRAARETEVDVVHLDDDMLQLRVPQGSIDVRVKAMDIKKDYEIDAPNSAIILDQDGEYRIDVSTSGDTTRVTAWSGHAQITANGQNTQVEAGQTALVRGDSTATVNVASAGASDDFDQWARGRDEREDHTTASARYVSADMGGLEDLDAYGGWVDNPDYGAVWFPTTVAVGWSPYSIGSWEWVEPWGWSWVDGYSWGWAPFHYGRWAFIGSAWGWCPGPLVYDPIWAPGLVAFVGGSTWGLGVGWFPLAPREPFLPWYRVGDRYRERLNGGREFVNVTSNYAYRNRAIPGAVTALPDRAFGNGVRVGRDAVHPSASDLSKAGVLDRGPGIEPTRGRFIGQRGAAPPARLASRSVEALHAPPPGESRPIRSAGAPGTRLARPGRTSLDQSYDQERRQLESRHMQEFANPRPTESRAQMYQRQEAEHRELNFRYSTARSGGMTRMPARVGGGGGHHR